MHASVAQLGGRLIYAYLPSTVWPVLHLMRLSGLIWFKLYYTKDIVERKIRYRLSNMESDMK